MNITYIKNIFYLKTDMYKETLGFKSENIETLPKGVCIDFFSELGFYVYLTDASNYPYNSWITNFYEEEFIFDRTLQFRFDKEYDDIEHRYAYLKQMEKFY